MLALAEVAAGYGAVPVVDGITIDVGEREIVALLGPNGAGKTTTLRTIAGLLRPLRGEITLDGRSISGLDPEDVAARGVQFVPEGGGLLRGLTVVENLRLSAWLNARGAKAVQPLLDRAFEVFPPLAGRQGQITSTLSGGERQMLALAQAIVRESRLILVDEASLGLSPVLVQTLFEAVARLRDDGRSVLLVEQNAHMALNVADRVYVLEKGRIVDSGPAKQVAKHAKLAGLYWGELEEP